jgi:hypothetical protein
MILRVLFWLLVGGAGGFAAAFPVCWVLIVTGILSERSDLLGVIGAACFISGLLAGLHQANERELERERKLSWMPHRAKRSGGPILPNAKQGDADRSNEPRA